MPEALLEKNNQTLAAREGKYLTFTLANQEYGLEIVKVKEIIGAMEVTAVPQTPAYVEGVINLRGKIIPVVNLRLKFGMEFLEHTDRTCIIVAEIKGRSGSIPMGMVVDSVSEVIPIRREEMEETPNFGVKLDTEYIMGMAKVKGKVIILLDIDQVLNVDGLLLMENLKSEPDKGEDAGGDYAEEEEQ
ncbi:MAG: chemotaxis protein CheW [bacterium]|nr:chemotaxis protein CheW [bacterium]